MGYCYSEEETEGNWTYRMHVSDKGLICFTVTAGGTSISGWLRTKEAKRLRRRLKKMIKLASYKK